MKYVGGWRKQWLDQLANADLVVIGGGQLLSDVSLNFPTKLYLLGRLIRGRRTAILSVGVSARWSLFGRGLVRKFFRDARPIIYGVRDAGSVSNLQAVFGISSTEIALLADPALITASAYSKQLSDKKSWDVGLCVSDVHSLNFNHDQGKRVSSPESFFLELHKQLTSAGKSVLLFTNGASEDARFATRLLDYARQVDPHDTSTFSLVLPNRPDEVVSIISSCSAIVAHRMHANIIAFSLGIPSIGIEWDPKLRGFFSMVKREEYLLPMDCSATSVAARIPNMRPIDASAIVELNLNLVNSIHRQI